MMVMYGPKHVASHTIKHDVFDENCFIILIWNFNTSGGLQSNFSLWLIIYFLLSSDSRWRFTTFQPTPGLSVIWFWSFIQEFGLQNDIKKCRMETVSPSLPSSTFSVVSNKIKSEKSTLQKQPHFVHENTLQIKIMKVSLNMTGSKMSVHAAEVGTQRNIICVWSWIIVVGKVI